MIIEKTDAELIIKMPADTDIIGLQRFLKYLEYKEATIHSVAKQRDVDSLVKQVKKGIRSKYAV